MYHINWHFQAMTNGRSNGHIAIPIHKDKLDTIHETSKAPTEPHKTLLALLLVFVAWLANDFALAIVHDKVPRNAQPLPDIWFAWFPEITGAIKIAELILCYSLFLVIVVMVTHTHRFIVARRIMFIISLAYGGRAFCIMLTQVPVPSPKTYCSPQVQNPSFGLILTRSFAAFARLGMDMNGRALCGDLIYSGHTILLFICHLSVTRYLPRRFKFLSWTTAVGSVTALICIMLARKHYSIDIAIGYYVATRIFYNYHTMVEFKLRNIDFERSFLDRIFWIPIFRYFEGNVKIPLPNTISLGSLLPK